MIPSPSRATVGVLGSGREEHLDLALPLGRLLARLGVNLLTGAGGGVMSSVCRAFTGAERAAGICIGIVPCAGPRDRASRRPGYPNPFVELAIDTHLPLSGEQGTDDLSRNHIHVLSSAALVALPGGAGTRSEIELALRYAKPIILFASSDALVAGLPESVRRARDIGDVEAFLAEHIPRRV